MITSCRFGVAALSDQATLSFFTEWHRSQVEEVNCLGFAAVGKAVGLSINWLDAAYCLIFPLWQVALVQLYKYHCESGERQASLKAAQGLLGKKRLEDLVKFFYNDEAGRLDKVG